MDVDALIRDPFPFLQRLSEAARGETMWRWTQGCGAEDKSGGGAYDPVTDADREAERTLRRLIGEAFPSHGLSGEEFGDEPGDGRWSWSLDPVDGTRAFVFGLPSWVTLIALLDGNRPIVGAIDAPALDELYVGGPEGSFLSGRGDRSRLRTSVCTSLADARLTTTDPAMIPPALLQGFAAIRDRCRLIRYGLDGYGYARLAGGSIDLVIEAGLKPHDYNALIPVIRGAGGVTGDWSGGDDFSAGSIIAAATRELYEAAVEAIAAAA